MTLLRGREPSSRKFGFAPGWTPVLVLFLAMTVLSGCGTGGAGRSGDLRDRVTASDESPEARRARVRFELATAYFGRGQLTTALDEVKLAIAADPTLGPAFNLRGLIYSNLGDAALAEASFLRALQLNPRDGDAMHNLGWHQCREKRYAEADQQFIRALETPQYREMIRTWLAQGVCQARAGRLEDAERTLTRAFEVDAGSPAIAVNLAEVLYRKGEFERARYYMRRVNQNTDVVSAETLWLAIRIENRMGNRTGLNELGAQLLNRFPQSPESRAFQRGRFDD